MFVFREPSINNSTIIGDFRLQRTQAVFTIIVFSRLTVGVSAGRAEEADGDVKLSDRDQQKDSKKAPDERLTEPGVAVEDRLVAAATYSSVSAVSRNRSERLELDDQERYRELSLLHSQAKLIRETVDDFSLSDKQNCVEESEGRQSENADSTGNCAESCDDQLCFC